MADEREGQVVAGTEKVSFRKGLESNLPTRGMADVGCVYLATDTGNVYVGDYGGGLIPVQRSPYYGTCATAASVNEKQVRLQVDGDNFFIYDGMTINVRFDNANTVASPTLNVNGKGAVAAKEYGTTAVGGTEALSWHAGEVVMFVYDGQYWMRVGEKPDLSPYENVQSDWEQTDTTAEDYIKNKPTIPAVGLSDDTFAVDSDGSFVPTTGVTMVNYGCEQTSNGLLFGKGTMTVRSILGYGCIVWNQLIRNGSFSEWTSGHFLPDDWLNESGVTTTNFNIGRITTENMSGIGIRIEARNTFTANRRLYCYSQELISGHKYLLTCWMKNSQTVYLGGTAGNNVRFSLSANTSGRNVITTKTLTESSGSSNLYIQLIGWSTGDYCEIHNLNVFDLTAMFGTGNEPTSSEFLRMFPSFHEYSEPRILGTYFSHGLFSHGYNLCYDGAAQMTPDTYVIDGAYTSLQFTSSRGAESVPSVDSDGHFAISSYGVLTVGGADGTTCVHRLGDGRRTGYESPWIDSTENVDSMGYVDGAQTEETLFSYGLLAIGDVRDEIVVDSDGYARTAVRRIGTRDYVSGDENDTSVVTDGTVTSYVLSTPNQCVFTRQARMTCNSDGLGNEVFLPSHNAVLVSESLPLRYVVDYQGESVSYIDVDGDKRAIEDWRIEAIDDAVTSNGENPVTGSAVAGYISSLNIDNRFNDRSLKLGAGDSSALPGDVQIVNPFSVHTANGQIDMNRTNNTYVQVHEIHGYGCVVWNQLAPPFNSTYWKSYSNTYATLSFNSSSHATLTVVKVPTNVYYASIFSISGTHYENDATHVILYSLSARASYNCSLYSSNKGSNIATLRANEWTPVVFILSGNTVDGYFSMRNPYPAVGATLEIKDYIRIDLTLMFGAGNEPTADEFFELFHYGYYEYSEPRLLGTRTDLGILHVGFNMRLFQNNVVPCYLTPDTYVIEGEYSALEFIESNGEVSIPSVDSDGKFVISSDGVLSVTSSDSLLCVHRFGDGSRIGYEDYWYNVIGVFPKYGYLGINGTDLVEVFPYGLLKIGNRADQIITDRDGISRGAYKNIGVRDYVSGDENDTSVVTDGTHTAYKMDGGRYYRFEHAVQMWSPIDGWGSEISGSYFPYADSISSPSFSSQKRVSLPLVHTDYYFGRPISYIDIDGDKRRIEDWRISEVTQELSYDDSSCSTKVPSIKAVREYVDSVNSNNHPDWEAASGTSGYIANKPDVKCGSGNCSVVENDIAGNESIGDYSHAEGKSTTAYGDYSHIEGMVTLFPATLTGSGNQYTISGASADVGNFIKVNGDTAVVVSVTDGTLTLDKTLGSLDGDDVILAAGGCSGLASHSEGTDTCAIGEASHAEGEGTCAVGVCSHAEGGASTAEGSASHAEGYGTYAGNDYEHAEGKYNRSNKVANSTYPNAGNTLSSIGFGTSSNDYKNAFEVMQNGDVYIYGIGGYDGTNPSEATPLKDFVKDVGDDGLVNRLRPTTNVSLTENAVTDFSFGIDSFTALDYNAFYDLKMTMRFAKNTVTAKKLVVVFEASVNNGSTWYQYAHSVTDFYQYSTTVHLSCTIYVHKNIPLKVRTKVYTAASDAFVVCIPDIFGNNAITLSYPTFMEYRIFRR